jgi:putative aminopeptidase FrvX
MRQKEKADLIGKEELEWLAKYIQNASPSGNEREGQRLWLERIEPFIDEQMVDNYGNVAGIINPGQNFKVIVEAHADEIAWYVNRIDDEGYIHVKDTGGTDPAVAPSQRVHIHTTKGPVPAVFGWPAVHTRPSKEDAPKMETIFLCCGATTREEAEGMGIRVGDYITYDSGFSIMNGNHYVGRALDNRMGGFMLARLAQMLKENKVTLPYSLYLVNAVQEEVGMKGAKMIAHTLQPSCAFVVDVTHDTSSPMIDKNKEGDMSIGKGPVITKAAPIHNKLRRLLEEVAEEQHICLQFAAEANETGTDADAFAYELGGIPTALISLPLRYMHTTVETMHKDDIEAGIRLLFHALQKLTPDFDFKYL